MKLGTVMLLTSIVLMILKMIGIGEYSWWVAIAPIGGYIVLWLLVYITVAAYFYIDYNRDPLKYMLAKYSGLLRKK